MKPLAERYYGGLKPSGVTTRVRPKEPPPLVARRMTLDDARVQQPQLTRFYLAPSYATDIDAAHALDVAAQILGGGDTSRLVRALVEEQKLAASAYAYFDSSSYDTTTFSIGGTPREGVTLEQIEAAMDKVLAEFLNGARRPRKWRAPRTCSNPTPSTRATARRRWRRSTASH